MYYFLFGLFCLNVRRNRVTTLLGKNEIWQRFFLGGGKRTRNICSLMQNSDSMLKITSEKSLNGVPLIFFSETPLLQQGSWTIDGVLDSVVSLKK